MMPSDSDPEDESIPEDESFIASEYLGEVDSKNDPQALTDEKNSHHNPVYNAYRETWTKTEGPFNIFYVDDADKRDHVDEHPTPQPSLWRKYGRQLYPSYFFDHLDYESFKVVSVTFVQIWSTVFLSVNLKTGRWFGSGNFLLQVFGFIVVAGGSLVSLNIYKCVICIIFYLFIWLCITIAMAITSRIRGNLTVEDYIRELIIEGTCTPENAADCFSKVVYSGRYLQTKTSVVWVFTIFFSVIIMGPVHKQIMLGRLAYVTGIIGIIVITAFSVFFPAFSPKEAGMSLFKPIGFAFIFQITVSSLIFPFSSSHKFFKISTGILKQISELNDNNIRFLGSLKPSDEYFSKFSNFSKLVSAIRVKLPSGDLFASAALYEISIGRFDSGDLGQFRSCMKNILTKSAGYEYFYQLLAERVDIACNKHTLQRSKTNSSSFSTSHNRLLSALQESYKEVGKYEVRNRMKLMSQKFPGERKVTIHDLDYIVFLINKTYHKELDTSAAFAAIIEWLLAANEFRTYTWIIPSLYKKHIKAQKENNFKIKAAREELRKKLESLENTSEHQIYLVKALRNEENLLSFISQSSLLIHIAKEQIKELIEMMDLFLEIDEKRPVPKIITYFTTTSQDKMKSFEASAGNESDPSAFTKNLLGSQIRHRDADAAAPSNVFQLFGKKLIHFYLNVLLGRSFLFWVKVGGLINICLLPYMCRTTAAWYINNRLMWLPITCGVSTAEYTAETFYIYFSKMVYSFLGCLLGVVGWYISCGKGRGNPYGYCAVTAVLFFFLCYYRHFAAHRGPAPFIMVTLTPSLVLGTSWVNSQFNKVGNIGWGIRVGYLRYISVVIGLAIAFLASTFPKPNSSKVAVRKALANVLDEIGNVHCTVSKFAVQRISTPSLHAFKRHDIMVAKFRSLLLSLAKVKMIMGPISYEVEFYGDWPQEKYIKLQELINDIIQLYYLVFSIIDEVSNPQEWMRTMIDRSGWSNSDLTASMFSVFYMLSSSLRGKDSLPKITHGNISMKHLDILSHQWGIRTGSLSERFYQQTAEMTENDNEEIHEILLKNLDFDKLFSSDGRLNIVILLLSHTIYRKVDETVLVVKGLVGEKYDFDEELLFDEDPLYKED